MNPEIMGRINNLDKLSEDDKKEMLRDTQRAGFSPMIHQVRVTFDLIDVIKKLDVNSTNLSKKIYILTWVIAALTLVMTVSTIIMIIK